MEKKKASMFDNIRVPLEDLTEEEDREMDNDPEFQKRLEKRIAETKELKLKYRMESNLDK